MNEIATTPHRNFELALVLGGGNALGAYQAGAYQALHERALEPDWVTGASIGAINGAMICGNAPDQRLPRLREFWRPAPEGGATREQPLSWSEEARRTQAVVAAMAAGLPGKFVPRSIYGPWWNPLGNPEPRSLYDSSEIEATLGRLLDFDRLNQAEPRFSATAVDIETGADIYFDTRTHRLTPRHLRASTALVPVFSPVEIEGRMVSDAGVSANLPLDLVLSEAAERPLLCIAIDLLPLHAPRPRTLGESAIRAQDLIFATQSRRAIAAWQAVFAERAGRNDTPPVTLLHIAYSNPLREVSGKAFDFSGATVAERWNAGYADTGAALDALALAGGVEPSAAGLTAFAFSGGAALAPIDWQLAPVPA